MASATGTDPHLSSLETRCRIPGEKDPRRLYLQTSPEFAMKRLIAAHSGPIYQVCKAFRDGEAGRLHNPEFTLLEWYRPEFDHHRLMNEVEELLAAVLDIGPATRLTYREAFRMHAGLDPFSVPLETLRQYAGQLQGCAQVARSLDRDGCLELILSRVVQPRLQRGAAFVFDFPASQACLARIRPGEPAVAARFELFVDGVELANGYHELGDSRELRQRFAAELTERRRRGLPEAPLDERLLAALEQGFPDCAGVALGIDRLVMLAAGADRLEAALSFSVSRV